MPVVKKLPPLPGSTLIQDRYEGLHFTFSAAQMHAHFIAGYRAAIEERPNKDMLQEAAEHLLDMTNCFQGFAMLDAETVWNEARDWRLGELEETEWRVE